MEGHIHSLTIHFFSSLISNWGRLHGLTYVIIAGGARVDLVDQDGHSPLHWAALGGNPDVCQILIENKINPNVQDYAGRTPLQCAAYGGYINCMVVLLENNADPNIQDKEVCDVLLYYLL